MAVLVGIFGIAHVHAPSFVGCCQADERARVVGVWDGNPERGRDFATPRNLAHFENQEELLGQVDAVVICSENIYHGALIEVAVKAGKHILCEKPIAATPEEAKKISDLVPKSDKVSMTSFPCPFSPTWRAAMARVQAGEIGKVVAVCATNQGTCPFGWFVEPELSGGGAMIDHLVHVTDLLNRLLGPNPLQVQAQVGNNIYGQEWEDTAMVTVSYGGGAFATIDSSWSKPAGYKTWGNVKLNIVGEQGVIELDLFAPGLDYYSDRHYHLGVGASLDALMVDEFLSAILEDRVPEVTLTDGLLASQVALAGYASVRQGGAAVSVRSLS
ncbi:MAG: Gfo/Idh/MocA family oxidoreductase [Fimbriimonadaceae bacterium]|jgi:predicted dehydrogenase|nr:Gfo/Idh/MocA family oxidoreductase [Fimbriimonadaceae bacterium]